MSATDPKGYYAILQLQVTASAAQIKAAYRRRAMELHPDRNSSPHATRSFQLLGEAYSVLIDPAARAQYDTSSIHSKREPSRPRANTTPDARPEPIVCSSCLKVTAQPRYAIFFEIRSFLVGTMRVPLQGIFCSACAEKKACRASAVTWILGWWGIPWGPIYSVQALAQNLFGGRRPPDINTRIVAHQAWVFAMLGKNDVARAVVLDALTLSRKVRGGANATQIRKDVEDLAAALGSNENPVRLRNSWALFRRPFYIQAIPGLVVIAFLGWTVYSIPPYSPPPGPKPYVVSQVTEQAVPPRAAYIRPAAAPNGEPWPPTAGYVKGYPRSHTNGLSAVTIDNGRNAADVFVKLVTLDGPTASPVRVFFVPAHGQFKLDKVKAGMYDIRYRDLETGQLSRSESFTLEETPIYNGTQYSEFTLTLYKVVDGNTHFSDLAESEF